MLVHLGLPHWQYAFTKVGLPPQTVNHMRFFAPDRLQLDKALLRTRLNIKNEHDSDCKFNKFNDEASCFCHYRLLQDKLKIPGIRRKQRRIKLKAKSAKHEAIITRFNAHSCQAAKYAKVKTKKRPETNGNGAGSTYPVLAKADLKGAFDSAMIMQPFTTNTWHNVVASPNQS